MLNRVILIILIVLQIACSKIELSAPPTSPQVLNLKIKNYCPSENKFIQIFASNFSYVIDNENLELDTDRDGLSNAFETQETISSSYNFNPLLKDSNSTGFSDLVLFEIGYKPSSLTQLPNCLDPEQDTDKDFLSDCDEATLGTDLQNPDSDLDGIPDGLEVRYGLNPLNKLDAAQDIDGDGISNLNEIRIGTSIYYANQIQSQLNSLKYELSSKENCLNITIQNIPIVNVSNGNLIQLIAIERAYVQNGIEFFTSKTASILVSKKIYTESVYEVDGLNNQFQIIDGVENE